MPEPAPRTRLTPADRRDRLIDAALDCIAEGGIRAFTVDRIAAAAGVSRGLVIHHFGSMDGLLAAVYARMYRQWLAVMAARRPGLTPIEAIVEAVVSPDLFDRRPLRVWLTLWGEVAGDPALGDEHRRQLAAYTGMVAEALAERAAANGRTIDAPALATAFVCLVDGLGVQRVVDPGPMTEDDARAACRALLEPWVGPLSAAR